MEIRHRQVTDTNGGSGEPVLAATPRRDWRFDWRNVLVVGVHNLGHGVDRDGKYDYEKDK